MKIIFLRSDNLKWVNDNGLTHPAAYWQGKGNIWVDGEYCVDRFIVLYYPEFANTSLDLYSVPVEETIEDLLEELIVHELIHWAEGIGNWGHKE